MTNVYVNVWVWATLWVQTWGLKDCVPMGSLLTYYVNGANGPCWPGFQPFQLLAEITDGSLFSGFTADRYVSGDEVATFIEVGGAYMEGGKRIGDLGPRELFLVETIVIDVSAKAAMNHNYEITIEDIEEWICEHGPIPYRCFVIFQTGWSYKRGDRYLGPDTIMDFDELGDTIGEDVDDLLPFLLPGLFQFAWPGLSPKAAKFLFERFPVVGVGIDTPSLDAGYLFSPYIGETPDSRGTRRYLSMYGAYLVHNLLLLDIQLPARGVFTTLGVFHMCKATRAPVNVYAEYCIDLTPQLRCQVGDYINVIFGNYHSRRR